MLSTLKIRDCGKVMGAQRPEAPTSRSTCWQSDLTAEAPFDAVLRYMEFWGWVKWCTVFFGLGMQSCGPWQPGWVQLEYRVCGTGPI